MKQNTWKLKWHAVCKLLCTPKPTDLDEVITCSPVYRYHAEPINELGRDYIMLNAFLQSLQMCPSSIT